MPRPLRVADLFCGPGGISEGFRLAGCEVVFGLDLSRDAVATFQHNHPAAAAHCGDVTELDPEAIPEFDVLVGGPPCVNFSSSKGGRANVLEGLRLVQAFLRIVYERQPKFWVMENVPRVAKHLPESIPLRWIGIDKTGELEIPQRNEFNAADFGVAQLRKRFLVGSYPLPPTTHQQLDPTTAGDLFAPRVPASAPWVTLADILRALPDPERPLRDRTLLDPNYGFAIDEAGLADHRHPVRLMPDEVKRIRHVKTEHPYMGRMAFPDDTDRPARTVVATQLGRETLVLTCAAGGGFQRASVRECATIQSFPTDYHFLGTSLGSRYRQAGDAVPPKLALALARQIVAATGGTVPDGSSAARGDREIPSPAAVVTQQRKPTVFPFDRRFRRSVPGKEIRGCRVDWDNQGTGTPAVALHAEGSCHPVEWQARLHVGESKANMCQRALTLNEALHEFAGFCPEESSRERALAEAFVARLEGALPGRVPDATTLQAVFTRRRNSAPEPDDITDELSATVNGFFPRAKFGTRRIPRSGRLNEVPSKGLLVRIAAGAVAAAYASELANHDPRWLLKNTGYSLEGWRPDRRRAKQVGGISGRFAKALAGRPCPLAGRKHALLVALVAPGEKRDAPRGHPPHSTGSSTPASLLDLRAVDALGGTGRSAPTGLRPKARGCAPGATPGLPPAMINPNGVVPSGSVLDCAHPALRIADG